MAKFCANCGTKLTGKFCTECGTRAISETDEEKRKYRAARKAFTNQTWEKTHRIIDLQADNAAWDFAERLVEFAIGDPLQHFPGKTDMILKQVDFIACALRAAVTTQPPYIRAAYAKWKEERQWRGSS